MYETLQVNVRVMSSGAILRIDVFQKNWRVICTTTAAIGQTKDQALVD